MNAPPPISSVAPGSGRARPQYQPRKIACPKCGDQLEIKDENGRMAVCPSCRSHIEITESDAKVLRQTSGPPSLAQVFQLNIGDHFKYQKARFEVIGRLRYDELEEPHPTCQYLLYNPRRGTRWLSEYAGHWDISHTSRVMPGKDPRPLKKGDKLTSYDGTKWLLAGKGVYKLTYVDGALPWVAKMQDSIEYAELVAGDGSGETYEVEYPSTGELEAGRGSLLTVDQVRQATGKDLSSPRGPRENIHDVTLAYGSMKKAALFFFVANLFLLIFFSTSGRTVLDQDFAAEELAGEVLSDPFEVRKEGSALKIRVHAPLDNAWVSVDLGLVRDGGAEPTVIHVTDQDMQYYSGREGGESWSEGSKSESQYLMVDEPGTYRLLVRAVSGRGTEEASNRSYVPLRIKVTAGAKRGVWLVLASLASFVIFIVVFVQHQKWRTADDEDDD